ncbi:MAG: hypothetical protein ABJA20_09435, partial [Novosphingobium sp.]
NAASIRVSKSGAKCPAFLCAQGSWRNVSCLFGATYRQTMIFHRHCEAEGRSNPKRPAMTLWIAALRSQ